jgi:formylglycine-generating enzyme
VEIQIRRQLPKRPYGPRTFDQRARQSPGRPVAYRDAAAYAEWAGEGLPTELARGRLHGAECAWGDELIPLASRWPHLARRLSAANLAIDGYERTSPVMGLLST